LLDDERFERVEGFEKDLALIGHLKKSAPSNTQHSSSDEESKQVGVRKAREGNLPGGSLAERLGELKEARVFRVLDRLKVQVDTTEDFPLDIKCRILFTEEDLAFYESKRQEQEELHLEKQNAVPTSIDQGNDDL